MRSFDTLFLFLMYSEMADFNLSARTNNYFQTLSSKW